jgi:hypothetical protein
VPNMKPKRPPEPNAPTASMRKQWTGEMVLWRTVPAQEGEVARWLCVDGRWVAVGEGHGASRGLILVLDSSGRCEEVASYDEAMHLAKLWRQT